MPAFKDLVGQTFGRLTVLEDCGSDYWGHRWRCRCECRNVVEVAGRHLRNGGTKSCGCYRDDRRLERINTPEHKDRLRDIGALNRTHGMSESPEYESYCGAKKRCNNPNAISYSDYGGRGIKFLFTSFEQFFGHVGLKPSSDHEIDRIDNDGHYEVGNVRWSLPEQQATNRRKRRWWKGPQAAQPALAQAA
jgi:hypothetical protein